MLNYIWLGLVVGAVLIGGWNGQLKEVADQSLEMANTAVVKIAFALIGVMALWLGIMRIAERAGLVALLAWAMRPVMKWIFPEVPAEHPAMGSMLMNMAANLLGLGNAATPLGLRAMRDLESLNPRPGTATNAMCTFLAINTSGFQLIPVTAIAILAANNSTNPTAIVGTSIICTACACIAGILMAKFLSKLPMFRLAAADTVAQVRETSVVAPAPMKWRGTAISTLFLLVALFFIHTVHPSLFGVALGVTVAWLIVMVMTKFFGKRPMSRPAAVETAAPVREVSTAAPDEKPAVKEAANLAPMRWWGSAIMTVFVLAFIFFFIRMAFPSLFGAAIPSDELKQSQFVRTVNAISLLSIPLLLSAIPLYAALRRVKIYEEFVDGAREGFDVAIRIIPYLVAMLVAVGMFRAAGGIDMLSHVLAPVLNLVGFPTDLLPMVLVRPLSGSGSLGFFTELVKQFGPDSLISRMGGTIYGSTETTFYVLAVYFGAVGIKRTRHALLAGLTADFVSVVVAVAVCRIMFG
jgi:spore maturation protein SpmA